MKISCNPFKCSKCATFIFTAFSILKSHNQNGNKKGSDAKKHSTGLQQAKGGSSIGFSEDNLCESVFLYTAV